MIVSIFQTSIWHYFSDPVALDSGIYMCRTTTQSSNSATIPAKISYTKANITVIRKLSYKLRLLIKGIKNGCLYIVEIRRMQGCAMVGNLAQAVGDEYKIIKKMRQDKTWIEA